MLKIWLALSSAKYSTLPQSTVLWESLVLSHGGSQVLPRYLTLALYQSVVDNEAFYNVHFSPPMLAPNVRASTCFRRCSYSDKDLMLPSWHRTTALHSGHNGRIPAEPGKGYSAVALTAPQWLTETPVKSFLHYVLSQGTVSVSEPKSARLMLSVLFCLSSLGTTAKWNNQTNHLLVNHWKWK